MTLEAKDARKVWINVKESKNYKAMSKKCNVIFLEP